MKKYQVLVTPEAEEGILSAFDYILQRSPANAEKWLRRLYREIDKLETMPERCALAQENDYFEETLRQLLFKSHRIIFCIDKAKKTVRVLYVRHGRQRALGQDADE